MSAPAPSSGKGNAIITLLTSPSYLPGTLVLLHALHNLHPAPRDFKIVCLVTPETVDAKTIGEVRKAGYDLVIGVEGIGSGLEGEQGLGLMGRPDLSLALTKLHLFRLSPLFSTILYLDADVLPLRPLSHLFESTNPHVLSACADTGWPDCFNSGVMVIRPRESDFEGMRGLMQAAIEGDGAGGLGGNGSFDGADQGLLNEWFSEEGGGGDWNRLSFTYNVTPSAAYQYAPAYKRYGHKISAVHFIGQNKPWSNIQYRPAGISNVQGKEASFDYSSLLDRWYAIYDAHVRPTSAHAPAVSSRFVVPETLAIWNQSLPLSAPQQPADRMDLSALKAATEFGLGGNTSGAYISLPLDGRVDLIMPRPQPRTKKVSFADQSQAPEATAASPTIHHSPASAPSPPPQHQSASWDATHDSPPQSGMPEMANAQIGHYTNAWDAPPTQQGEYFSKKDNAEKREPQYPTLPASVVNDSWYKQFTEGPKPNAGAVGAVFPWEGKKGGQKKAERVFPRGSTPPPTQPAPTSASGQGQGQGQGHKSRPSFTVQLPTPPGTSSHPQSLSEAMASYRNAWDSDPSIAAYISRITHTSSSAGGIVSGSGTPRESEAIARGLQSVPPTPKGRFAAPEERVETRSNGSGDGDDEGEDESGDEGLPKKKRNANPRYRDRQAQTDKQETADVGHQWAGAGGAGTSPETRTSPLPNRNDLGVPGGQARKNSNTSTSSGSESTVTPLPAAKPRRIPFPVSQSSTDRIPQRTTKASPITFTSTLPTGLSPTGAAGGAGAGHKQQASRTFDPSTDVDTRRRETQEVLTRFMR
ncbi:nucleotide-diphospho-sugar transferase, partial [Dioszegia hungarica]